MILSTVTDEVLPDRSPAAFPRIFETALKQGVSTFEIRMIEGKRYPLGESEAWNRLRKYGKEYDITFTTVSPGLFKTGLTHDFMPLHRNQLTTMSLDLAEAAEISTLVVFGVSREETDGPDSFAQVVDILRETTETAAARGFKVQLENLPHTWADTADNCLALLKAVDHPDFGYVWDVGNLYDADQEHFLEGYKKLKPYIRNVHLKDGQYIDGKMVWQQFGKGKTDIKGQVEALKADDYKGTLSVEAKCEPQTDEDFPNSLEYLRSCL